MSVENICRGHKFCAFQEILNLINLSRNRSCPRLTLHCFFKNRLRVFWRFGRASCLEDISSSERAAYHAMRYFFSYSASKILRRRNQISIDMIE